MGLEAAISLNDLGAGLRRTEAESRLRCWLLGDARSNWTDEAFLAGLAKELRAAGLDIFRVMLALSDSHPQVWGRIIMWRQGEDVSAINESYENYRNEEYLQGPMPVIHGGAAAVRRRLTGNAVIEDFPIVPFLKAQGATDYIAMALPFTDGTRHFISFATRREGGFSEDELSLLDALIPLIALRIEVAHTRRMMSTLLRTYLGGHAAARVEAGTIRRAHGEAMSAIIAFADLRGFTRMSNYLSPSDVINVLSHYYEAVAEPWEGRGAEINKLIGDGMLALFPLESDDPLYLNARASSIVQGVREAFERLVAIPPEALPGDVKGLRAGFALHVGDVTFGNVGSKTRLDFTVIGPAVNEASRLQLLTKTLGRPLLITKAFSQLPCSIKFESLGMHELSGFEEKKEIFALPGF